MTGLPQEQAYLVAFDTQEWEAAENLPAPETRLIRVQVLITEKLCLPLG